jgi:hypothetical protein
MSLAGGVATSIVLTSERTNNQRQPSKSRAGSFTPGKKSTYTAPIARHKSFYVAWSQSLESTGTRRTTSTQTGVASTSKKGTEHSIAPDGESRKDRNKKKGPSFLKRWLFCSSGV